MTILFIKLVHTLIFFILSGGVVYMLYSGVANRLTRWTWMAALLIGLESVALVLNGWTCPLTTLAERYGAARGEVADIFLPPWLAANLFPICTPTAAVAAVILVLRRPWRSHRR